MPQSELSDEQWSQIENHLAAGQKIQAIKLFRQWTSCDLKTAKDVLDRHESELQKSDPQRFKKKTGCGTNVLLMILSIATLTLTALWVA